MEAVKKNERVTKPTKTQVENDFLAEQEARHYLETIAPGRPTGEYVMLKVKHGDIGGQSGKELNEVVFEVIDVGPAVHKKNEDLPEADKILPGKWIQMKPSSQIIVVDWGDRMRIMIPDFAVALIFYGNPKKALADEIQKQKILQATKTGEA
jgi:hypothetical protein